MDLIEKAANRLANLDAKEKKEQKAAATTVPEKVEEKAASAEKAANVNAEKGTFKEATPKKATKPDTMPAEPDVTEEISDANYQSSTVRKDTVSERKEPAAEVHKLSTPLVNIDLEKLRFAGMVVPDSTRSKIKEEFRHVKRPLLMNASGKGTCRSTRSNLIMVSSAQPGEGKTFSAINLALSIAAERDKTVLLVDADVVPSIDFRILWARSQSRFSGSLNQRRGYF